MHRLFIKSSNFVIICLTLQDITIYIHYRLVLIQITRFGTGEKTLADGHFSVIQTTVKI
jgi:hypothetical protein